MHIYEWIHSWLGNRKGILILNREDMISTTDQNAWANYYGRQGIKVVFSNGKLWMGSMKLGILANSVVVELIIKCKAREACFLAGAGWNSSLSKYWKIIFNQSFTERRMCPAAPRPGVTSVLGWVRFGSDLELLDSPGIIPMEMSDQSATIKLAIGDNIGEERSYTFTDVAGIL